MPEHHVHDTYEPLPGAQGAAPTNDYSAATIERLPSSAWKDLPQPPSTHAASRSSDNAADRPPQQTSASATHHSESGVNAFNSDRPMNTEPAPGGGVAIDGGDDDMPMGKASMADKLVGKTEKVIGKVTKKPELHEKGELRESGGKAAALGQARAPHD